MLIPIEDCRDYCMKDVYKYVEFIENSPQLYEKIEKIAAGYLVEHINSAFEDERNGDIKSVIVACD